MKKTPVTLICKSCKEEFQVPFWKSKGHTTRCEKCRKRHKQTSTRLYQIWENMKQRCYNPKNTNYKGYGAKGIDIQENWKNNFMEFYEWASKNGYSEELTIDRINGSKGYNENNCRWTTQTVQCRNVTQVAKNNTTGYKGVFIKNDGRSKKYAARITVDYKVINLGSYYTLKEAALAYNNYIIEHSLEHTLNLIKKEVQC